MRRGTAKYVTEWIAALVAVLLLSPVLLTLAVLVKLTSRGPVIYRAERLGRHGRVFTMYKFRSMKLNSSDVLGPDGKVLTLKADPRVTPIGRFLRIGFDELPQLINVLKGDMCLIGPRPDLPAEKERYTGRQAKRLAVRPGITGLAQVVGGRYMNNAQNYELDVLYVEQATWKTDLLILLLTLPYALGRERVCAAAFRSYVAAVVPRRTPPPSAVGPV